MRCCICSDLIISNEFQVDTSILYNQFELFTDEQKWTQIVLLNDLIYKIKEAFNKEFESVFQKKLQELAKIRERNTRIKQINADLDDASPVWEPDLTEKEKPQLLFEVKDNEVSLVLIVMFIDSIRFVFRSKWNATIRLNSWNN